MYKKDDYPEDLTGLTFGRLTVLEKVYKDGILLWKCDCSCKDHNIKYVYRRALITGNTKSCGCLLKESRKKSNSGQFKSIDHNDIIGNRFGKLTVLSIDHVNGKHYYYKCHCDCDREDPIKERSALLNGTNTQCSICYAKERKNKAAYDDKIIGKTFGRLTVLAFDHFEKKLVADKDNAHSFIYKCQCSYDGKIIYVDKYMLTSGKTTSCGCLAREVARETHLTHGMYCTRFYKEWSSINQRIFNPNCASYKSYGGRGITICDRWRDFENFKEDMYDSYLKHVEEFGESDTTIERINVNGNYEPSNCTWATKEEQNRNMTTNIRLTYNGIEYIAIDLWRMFCPDITYNGFMERLKKYGYKMEI